MHNAMTGPMGTMFSPLDPLFYLHHSFIDYTWTQGQSGWAAKGWPLSAQFGGEKMDGSSCAMTDKLPGYVNQVSEVIDTASLCILYSVPVVSSQIAQPNPANATCPPPLSATWIAMQEAGNKNKGDVLKADQLMFTRCQALLNQAKKNITVPPMPEVSDKDRTFVSDTPLSPPPVADVERATGGAVGSQVSVTLLAVILVISAL